jgi:hypothetical protein
MYSKLSDRKEKLMTQRYMARLSVLSMVILILVLAFGVSPASAARDRKPPTTPTNLRVTGMTSYSVSLEWTPSTDDSGSVTYTICCANVSSETFPGPASSRVYRAGLEANRSFTLRISARDAAGNSSGYSNSVTFTLPRDTIPPTKPEVTLTDVGPTHVSLAWSSVEEGPVWFAVLANGTNVTQNARDTSGTFAGLQPETAYTFTVQARDFGGNVSPVSDPVTVTTEPSNADDTTPPTTPSNLSGSNFGEETWLVWGQSTDNLTPQSLLQYEVYVNGVLDHTLIARGETVLYGTAGIINTFEVIAVDESGNRSAPATFTIDMR